METEKENIDKEFIIEHIKKIEKAMAEMYFEQKRLKGVVEEFKLKLQKLDGN